MRLQFSRHRQERELGIQMQEAAFDLGRKLEVFQHGLPLPEVVSFVECAPVSSAVGKIHSIYFEHYPEMAWQFCEACLAEANMKWRLLQIKLLHRVGVLLPGEVLMLVAVAAADRADAFAACEFIVERLKASLPMWKKEYGSLTVKWANEDEAGVLNQASPDAEAQGYKLAA